MARKPPHKRKLNGFGYRSAASFIKLDHGLLKSDAWQHLSPDATKVLLDLWSRHNGINNGSIGYAQRAAHECLCLAYGRQVSRRRATAALQEIQDKGFAVVTKDSKFTLKSKLAREWRLTAERAGDERPTRDFKHWKIQNTGTSTVPHKHRDGACEANSSMQKRPHKHQDGACNDPLGTTHGHRDGATSNIPGTGVWPATGYRLTGPELATLCIASGHSVRSFARLIGVDGRKLRGKCLVDYSEDVMARGAIDQMRTEAIKTTSKSSAAKNWPGAASMKGK